MTAPAITKDQTPQAQFAARVNSYALDFLAAIAPPDKVAQAAGRIGLALGDPPGIGAAVAMVAASQVRWIVWGRFIGSREWVVFEAWGTQAQAAAREKYNSGARPGVEFRVLAKGVQP